MISNKYCYVVSFFSVSVESFDCATEGRGKRCGIVRNFEDVESGQGSRLDQSIFIILVVGTRFNFGSAMSIST